MNLRWRRVQVVAFVVSALGVVAPAWAQVQRPMGIVDLLSLPRLGDPQVAPNGRDLVYTQSDADWKTGKRITHIWRTTVDGAPPVQVTNGTDGENTPRWSPDGRTIAFVAKRGDNESAQIYLLAANGGEAKALTSHASAVSDISWTPDGSALFFLAPEPKTADDKAREKAKDDVYSFEENYKQAHLWKVAVAGAAETRVSSGDYSITSFKLSDDGRRVAFERAPNPLLGSDEDREVWTMNADGTSAAQLTKNRVGEVGSSFSPDNSQVLFVVDANARFETYYNSRLFIVPSGGGSPRAIVGEDAAYDVGRAIWSKDGKSIYFTANMGVHDELFVVPAAGGKPKPLTSGQHGIGGVTISGDRAVFAVSDSTSADLWTLDLAAPNATMSRVTHAFDYVTRTFKLGKQEAIQWKGVDGTTVEGILTYPVDYQAGQKYPLAVMTHGGPQAADKFSLGSSAYEIQVLAGRGYASLQPNYRGSTGYGDAFLRDMVGHYFQNAHLDVIAGVDEVIRRGVADPDRLVKMGWSAGGHMTNKIVTFTDRFKAAAAGAGASDWVSMYAQSDMRSYRTPWFGGTPWQSNAPIDAYWSNSPLKDVSKVKTPTIFFVGEQDQRVPMPQSVEMYRGLKSNGVPTHLYVAPREPHGWNELRHQLFKVNIEIEWFEKYATKRPYVPEQAPAADEKTDDKKDVKPTDQ